MKITHVDMGPSYDRAEWDEIDPDSTVLWIDARGRPFVTVGDKIVFFFRDRVLGLLDEPLFPVFRAPAGFSITITQEEDE